MEIVKPLYVNYQQPRKDSIISGIYSIDIHPSGTKYATSGGSDKNGTISIWNMEALRSKEKEKDENCPKLLFSDSSHLKCVQCVRWSPSGKYLASGSVDSLVFIWIQRKLSEFDRKNSKHQESYRLAYQLRGHQYDVVDLAWSPQGNYLCSGGMDNKIIVWNSEHFPEKTVVLSGHNSIVKGLSWDPVGRYLASQSDDKTLRIWRTSDWRQEAQIEDKIDSSLINLTFCRLSWSPDGMNVIGTGTANNGAPTCQTYNRDKWTAGVDMIGHRQHLLFARYFPRFLKDPKSKKDYSLLALGGRDRSLSLWATYKHRPVAVITDLFTDTLYDISWHVENLELIVSSLDGTIVYIKLDPDHFGSAFNDEEMTCHLEGIYGKNFFKENLALTKSCPETFVVPESSAVLDLHSKRSKVAQETKGSCLQSLSAQKSTGPREQIIQRTENGKRRITPKFLNRLDEDDIDTEVTLPKKRLTDNITSSLNVDTCMSHLNNDNDGKEKLASTSTKTMTVENNVADEKTTKAESSMSTETKKMDKLMTRLESTPSEDSKSNNGVIVLSSSSTIVIDSSHNSSNKTASNTSLSDIPQGSATQNAVTNSNNSSNNKSTELVNATPNRESRKIELYKDNLEKLSRNSTKPLINSFSNVMFSSSSTEMYSPVKPTKKHTTAEKRLRQVTIKNNTSLLCCLQGEPDHYMVIVNHETYSQSSSDDLYISKLYVNNREQRLWEAVISNQISVVINFKERLFVGDVSGSLHIFYLKGGRQMPPLMLGCGGITGIFCDGKHLSVVTCDGVLHIWTLFPFSFFIRESFAHILTDDGDKIAVKSVSVLNDEKLIGLIFESGSSFLFNKELHVWQEVFDMSKKLECWSLGQLIHKGMSNLVLGSMQKCNMTHDNFPKIPSSTKMEALIDRLEKQLKLAETLNSSQEYKYWLIVLMRHLIESDNITRVRHFCYELLGPVHRSSHSSWDPYIMNISKRDLLEEIMPLFALNLRMQGLYTEIKDQLELLPK